MSKAKTVISMEEQTLAEIDRLVSNGMFSNRSQAITGAVRDRIARFDRLARECAKLDRVEEQELADEQ